MSLIHGGQLQQVAQQYKIPASDWLDLSTGIAPISYPVPEIPLSAWQQLPQYNPALIVAAKQYYQCSQLVITNGSQAIIKELPRVYRQKNANAQDVYLPVRGYKEHAHAWKGAGYKLHFYQEFLPNIAKLLPNSVLVVINPNNPTGQSFDQEVIRQYHKKISQLNGLLVLDEAFIDVMPSTKPYGQKINDSHCIVLRSFGKFFGLAGIRIGFLVADQYWCKTFEALLGPWQVNGPAQIIAEQALSDSHWQNKQRQILKKLRNSQEEMLWRVFSKAVLLDITGCDLFLTLAFKQQDNAQKLYHLLCQQAVYCRLADEQDTLRFGIANADTLERLANACANARKQLIFAA